MNKLTLRRIQNFNALLTLFVLLASFYFEYILNLTPCPLCIMQRVCVFLLLAIMGLSLQTLKKTHLIALSQIVIAGAGLYFALRQLWLASLPPGNAPACMPGLDVLIRYFPWQAVVKALFLGTGECGEVSWRMLGISMPGWSALYFLFIMIMGCLFYWQTRPNALANLR